MRPLVLKGHERSLTSIKYNTDSDLLFTASKDKKFVVWYTDNGERLGTYNGHNGSVYSLDVDRRTERILSGAADTYAKLWDVQYGREIMSWTHKAPVRSVNWSLSEKQLLTVSDTAFNSIPSIYVWDTNVDPSIKIQRPVLEIQGKNDFKFIQAMWGPLNENIIAACEDGSIRVYDIRNGEQTKIIQEHSKAVMQISYNKTKTMFVSASRDGSAKLFDAKTFKCLKTYTTGRPINSASISPDEDYEFVICGGGQPADSVTTTRVDAAQFRIRFYHMIYQEEIGSVSGHFGPVNCVTFSPDGKGYTSGAEDGYIRVHHFDRSYFSDYSKESFKNRKKFLAAAANTNVDEYTEEN